MASNWWDPDNEGLCVWAAYQPQSAESFAASLTDLAGNGNNAVDPGGGATPGWNEGDGWTFDGIAQYLATTFVPQNDQSQTVIVGFSHMTVAWGGGWLAGVRMLPAVPDRFGIGLFNLPPFLTAVEFENGGSSQHAPILMAGNLCVTGNECYRNGVYEAPDVLGYGGVVDIPLYIGCRNLRGVGADSFLPVYIQALAIYDCVLTAGQVLAIVTAMGGIGGATATLPADGAYRVWNPDNKEPLRTETRRPFAIWNP